MTTPFPRSRVSRIGRAIALCAAVPSIRSAAYIAAALEAQRLGFGPFVAFPELQRVYRSSELPAFFKNRVLQPKRPDFPEHLLELEAVAV